MIRFIYVQFSILLFFSCTPNNKSTQEHSLFAEVTFSEKKEDVQTKEFFELIDSIFILNLQSNEQFFLGSISEVRFTEDRIYVLDATIAKALFVFNLYGYPLFRVGTQGRGPGEYYSIGNFFITQEHIIILDDGCARMLVFDTDGVFQYQIETSAYHMGMIDDTTFVAHNGSGILSVQNIEGDTLRTFALDFKGIESVYPNCFTYQDSHLNFIDMVNQRIYRIMSDSIVAYRHILLGKWQIPPSYYTAFRGNAPNNMYENVFQKTTFQTNYGLLAGYRENATWEFYRFLVKLPRTVYRHKASGKTFLLGDLLWKIDIDKGFQHLAVLGAIATKNNFFITSVLPEKALDFIEDNQIHNPMLLRLQERTKNMNISENDNPLLLFYRLKDPLTLK